MAAWTMTFLSRPAFGHALRTGHAAGCAWNRAAAGSGDAFQSLFRRGVRVSSVPGSSSSTFKTSRRTVKMARVEAVLLVADTALPPRRLAQLATLADATEARTLVNRLNDAYDHSGTPFRVERVASGYRLFTRPEYALWLSKLHQREAELKLSPPALETLTIIAYRQPMTRADIEAIRGVQCAEILKQLMDRGLVRIAGTDDSLGHPFLYECTRKFLETFGLRDIEDLPLANVLRRPSGQPAPEQSDMPPLGLERAG